MQSASHRPCQLEPDLPSNPNTGTVSGHHTLGRGEVRPPICKGRLSGHPPRCERESIAKAGERNSEREKMDTCMYSALSVGNNHKSTGADRISAHLS